MKNMEVLFHTSMAPKLRISAGPTANKLELVAVNHDDKPVVIDSDCFQGKLTVRVKNFHGELPENVEYLEDVKYFSMPYGSQMTYSIQMQGRFPAGVNANDLVFGNEFDEPIRVRRYLYLSTYDILGFPSVRNGTSLALRIIHRSESYVIVLTMNSVKHDLYGDKPWALSPFLSTVFRAKADRAVEGTFSSCASAKECFERDAWPKFPQPNSEETFLEDDISSLFYHSGPDAKEPQLDRNMEVDENVVKTFSNNDKARQHRMSWLGSASNRKKLNVTPDDIITADFGNGFVRSDKRAARRLTADRFQHVRES